MFNLIFLFISGFILGVYTGIVTMCLFKINKEN